ncbi:hypothetical protein Tco_0172666 [Tanacetum coccineum]
MKNLKNQLQDLERQHKQKRITSLIDDPWRLPSTPFVGVSFDPQPLPRSYTHTTSPSLNIWASKQRRIKPSTKKEPTSSQELQSITDIVTSTKSPDVLPIQKDLTLPKHAWHASWRGHGSTKMGKGAFAWNLGHQENPNQETPTEFPKSDIKQHSTFDDVPPLKWRKRSIEMLTWCTAEFQYYAIDQEYLGNEAYRASEERNVTISQTTFGELYQLILNALAKLCNQKKFLAEFERTGKRLGTTYDEPGDSVLCMITYSDFSSDDESDSDSLDSDSDFGFYMINPIPHVLPIQEDPLLPLAKIHLLIDGYAKPIPIIAFFDTGVGTKYHFHFIIETRK